MKDKGDGCGSKQGEPSDQEVDLIPVGEQEGRPGQEELHTTALRESWLDRW